MTSRVHLSACLCFRDAAAYLPEWLAFHRVVGVEHFYLYNNESRDDFASAVSAYVRRGYATLIDFPGRGVQHEIYAHCLREHGPRTRWLLFCDDDEFLFPVADVRLGDALAPFEAHAGVAVSWVMYGGAGHAVRPPGLVTESYRWRAPGPDPHVKCVVQPEKVVEPVVIAHEFRCRAGERVVNEQGVPMSEPFSPRPTADVLRINHYAAKSRAELTVRRTRIQANTGELSPLTLAEWMALEAGWNAVEDPIACRYGDRVRAVMAEMSA